MAELGNTLSRARRARGITLEDAERDTHVSKRYLQALESEEFSSFPAPVYARGFLRTYSRYLGLNPEELIRVFPNGDLVVDITPLPTVSRPASQTINVNWVIAGAVMLLLLGAAFLIWSSGSNTTSGSDAARRLVTPPAANPGNPAVIAPATSGITATQGKPISVTAAGVVPDFVGADVPSALAVLRDNQINYVIIEGFSKTTPKGIVTSQTPGGGAKSNSDQAVTLTVSKGAQ
jgi:hypothetical protein